MDERQVMQAASVEVLVHKGRFDPAIALAIAEAMDITLSHSQLVTVPVLDQRIDAVKSEVRELRSEMKVCFQAVDGGLDARFKAAEERMEFSFRANKAEMKEASQRFRTEMIFWIIGVNVGTALLPKLGAALAEQVRVIAQVFN